MAPHMGIEAPRLLTCLLVDLRLSTPALTPVHSARSVRCSAWILLGPCVHPAWILRPSCVHPASILRRILLGSCVHPAWTLSGSYYHVTCAEPRLMHLHCWIRCAQAHVPTSATAAERSGAGTANLRHLSVRKCTCAPLPVLLP